MFQKHFTNHEESIDTKVKTVERNIPESVNEVYINVESLRKEVKEDRTKRTTLEAKVQVKDDEHCHLQQQVNKLNDQLLNIEKEQKKKNIPVMGVLEETETESI